MQIGLLFTLHWQLLGACYLTSIHLPDNENFTPQMDADGLWVGASSPGETCQWLIFLPKPVLTRLQATKKGEVNIL